MKLINKFVTPEILKPYTCTRAHRTWWVRAKWFAWLKPSGPRSGASLRFSTGATRGLATTVVTATLSWVSLPTRWRSASERSRTVCPPSNSSARSSSPSATWSIQPPPGCRSFGTETRRLKPSFPSRRCSTSMRPPKKTVFIPPCESPALQRSRPTTCTPAGPSCDAPSPARSAGPRTHRQLRTPQSACGTFSSVTSSCSPPSMAPPVELRCASTMTCLGGRGGSKRTSPGVRVREGGRETPLDLDPRRHPERVDFPSGSADGRARRRRPCGPTPGRTTRPRRSSSVSTPRVFSPSRLPGKQSQSRAGSGEAASRAGRGRAPGHPQAPS